METNRTTGHVLASGQVIYPPETAEWAAAIGGSAWRYFPDHVAACTWAETNANGRGWTVVPARHT